MTNQRTPYTTDLSDSEWSLIQPYAETPQIGRGRRRIVNLREIANAICYYQENKCPWGTLPSNFPPSETVYYYFRKWKDNGLLDHIDNIRRRRNV